MGVDEAVQGAGICPLELRWARKVNSLASEDDGSWQRTVSTTLPACIAKKVGIAVTLYCV